MARRRRPPSQGWKTFLRNHADGIASLDLFVVPTISFQLLYGLLILKHGRREILCLAATAHPSAEWISRQLTEAYGWEEGPAYLVRDRDSVYGEVFVRRLRAMGIRDRPTSFRSPWQNGYCERLIGWADRILPIASLARSRDPGASPSAQCPAAEITQAADLRRHRSADIRRTLWLGAKGAERLGDCEARNRNPVAPRRFSFVLAMEVKIVR